VRPFLRILSALVLIILSGIAFRANAQSVRLDNLKEQFGAGKPIRFSGGLAANGIFYDGNGGYGRNPFSYFVNGSINMNLYNIVNLPFTFTLSDFGGNYSYPIPSNRFSIHPSYKFVTGHIGDIAMTFSPYTLNGYLFRGVGVDVEPEGPFKGSVIYGRLQKANEYDTANHTVPAAYERNGFGARLQFQKGKYRAGLIVFRAWDDQHSLRNAPDSLGIYPMENTVVSVNGGLEVVKNLDLTVEVATSALTRDVRAEDASGSGIIAPLVDSKASTGFYNAFKTGLQYTLQNTVLGVGYERIDPGYQTLGAYYINNDLENITVNAAQPLFHGKVQIAMNAGFQRDNLDGDKSGSSTRAVGSVNLSYIPNTKVSAVLNYSNFQTFMRIRPQFQTINQLDNFQQLDTLDYTQTSQNATGSLSYTLKQTDAVMRMLTFDVSFQETGDKQGGVVRNGNGSRFYNGSVQYNFMQLAQGFNVLAGFNVTYNTIGRNDFITLGPTVGANAKLFKKRLTTGGTVSYNASKSDETWDSRVLNIRANALYNVLKRHTFSLNVLNQLRSSSASKSTHDLTVTVGYNFTFG
jgi:hypothetical protein